MATISKAFIEEFIELYRNQPALWHTQSENYKNKIKKNKCWMIMLNKYKEVDEDATIETTKNKINSLRSAYRRELQKIRQSEINATTEDEIYVPTLWYFNNLSFVRDQDYCMEEDTNSSDEDYKDIETTITDQRSISIRTEPACISKNFIEELIKMYKNEQCLWNAKSETYKNKNLKYKAWHKLLAKFKQVDADATVDSVKKKINSLRAAYRRELHKLRDSENSDAGPDEVYKPSLWYFSSLSFLRKQEEHMADMKEMAMMEEECMEQDIKPIILKPLISPISSTPTKRKRSEVYYLETAAEHLENSKNQRKKDDADIFGEGWARMFRKLDEAQKIFAKHLIDDSLMYGQLGHLTYNSSIELE